MSTFAKSFAFRNPLFVSVMQVLHFYMCDSSHLAGPVELTCSIPMMLVCSSECQTIHNSLLSFIKNQQHQGSYFLLELLGISYSNLQIQQKNNFPFRICLIISETENMAVSLKLNLSSNSPAGAVEEHLLSILLHLPMPLLIFCNLYLKKIENNKNLQHNRIAFSHV